MALQTGEEGEQRVYWQSHMECITAISQYALAKKVSEFYAGKFVVGTQTFAPRHNDNLWTAFVYTKRRESN
jgi:hypothetical protein